MKRLTTTVTLLLLLGACNQSNNLTVSTPSPAQAKGSANCPGGLTGLECDTYKQGIQAGLADRAAHQSDSFKRHANDFDPRYEASFRAGYATGWYNNGK